MLDRRGRSDKGLCKAAVVRSDMDFTPYRILGLLDNQFREDDTGVLVYVT